MANIKGNKAANQLNGTSKDDLMYGYEGNDILTAGAGNDLLDGGLGMDTMIGGIGNDTYIVDNAGDAVAENVGEGFDTVQASVSYSLDSNIEKLVLTGTNTINGTGNSLDNTLVGNNADNILDGAQGADNLFGGLGNDTYIVDNAGDVVVENFGEGFDTVQASVSYSLDSNIEKLVLIGTDNINGTGNNLNNTLVGNDGNNLLMGGDGVDTLAGGHGNDTLVGGSGSDTYLFAAGDGHDIIQEIPGGNGDLDTVKLAAGIDPSQVSLVRDGADLLVRLNASGEDVRVAGQFSGTGIEQIQFANGTSWGATEINNAAWQLTGTSGNDFIGGHAGVDLIQGLGGNDTLVGGSGSDTFYFDTALNASTNIDTITDFSSGSDQIFLENTGTGLFNALSVGTLESGAFDIVGTGPVADSNTRIIYDPATGALSYDADGIGGEAAIQFGMLGTTTHPTTLSNTDFTVI